MRRADVRGLADLCAGALADIRSCEADLPLSGADGARTIRELLGAPPDLVVGVIGTGVRVLYLSTIVDANRLQASLAAAVPLVHGSESVAAPACISEVAPLRTRRDAVDALLAARAVVLVEGQRGGWAVTSNDWPHRQITEPPSEMAERGPHSGFVEILDTNVALLRHRVPDPRLRWEKIQTGQRSGTPGALLYMDGLVEPAVLARMRRRLRRIAPSFATDSAMLDEWLAPRSGRFFPTIGRTERPDKAAAALLEGRVVLLASGSPTALVVPNVLADLLHVPEDYYQRPSPTELARAVRVVGMLFAVAASPLYVAFATVNQELIPTSLYVSIAQARRGVPIPLTVEVLALELVVDIIRQAGLRLPGSVGQSISIIGAVVIGQSAVMAGLISAPTIVVVAFCFIASFTIPVTGLVQAVRTARFPLILLAAAFGLFGIALGLMILFAYLCSLESFGVPYLAPLTPGRPRGFQDTLWRASAPRMRRSFLARNGRRGGGR